MSSTKPQLLRVALEVTGSASTLAERLEISEPMLERYLSGAFPVPDSLMLRVLDVIVEERERAFTAAGRENPPESEPHPEA